MPFYPFYHLVVNIAIIHVHPIKTFQKSLVVNHHFIKITQPQNLPFYLSLPLQFIAQNVNKLYYIKRDIRSVFCVSFEPTKKR